MLCRHGETSANAAGILQGQSESELTACGKEQAQNLAEEMCRRAQQPGPPFARTVYASDLGRAANTAAAVVAALQRTRGPHCLLGPYRLVTDVRLRERRLGPLQGRTTADSRRRFPKTWGAVFNGGEDPAGGRWPAEAGSDENGGIELSAEVRTRAKAALREIAAAHPNERVCLVSHGGWIFSAVLECTALQKDQIDHLSNVSITTLLAPRAGLPTSTMHRGGLRWAVTTGLPPWEVVPPLGDVAHVRVVGSAAGVNVDVSS